MSANASAKGGFTASDAGIVTPDIATGMRSYERFSNDTNGTMLVCPFDPCMDLNLPPSRYSLNHKQWVVGFTLVAICHISAKFVKDFIEKMQMQSIITLSTESNLKFMT